MQHWVMTANDCGIYATLDLGCQLIFLGTSFHTIRGYYILLLIMKNLLLSKTYEAYYANL